jgi:hypothetical protein
MNGYGMAASGAERTYVKEAMSDMFQVWHGSQLSGLTTVLM